MISPRTSTGEIVRLPVDLKQVALEVTASDRYGMHDDNDWASLTPPGHGFVHLSEGYYALSMYHQLHCLNSFRRMFNAAAENKTVHQADSSVHALHCLTYLRQMVLCSADVTLEPARHIHFASGRQTTAAYGMGVTHQCRDWVQVREYVEENYLSVMKGEGVDDFIATEAGVVNS